MKLWVDDLREPPDTWTWAKTSHQALELLQFGLHYDIMSLDHDLGGEDTTRPIILYLCEHPNNWPRRVVVHTANPVGREWLQGMIERYKP